MKKNANFVLPVTILSISFIICTLLLGLFLKARDQANQTINVIGSANRDVISDLGILRGNLQASCTTAGEAYQNLLLQQPAVLAYLAQQGSAAADYQPKYDKPELGV